MTNYNGFVFTNESSGDTESNPDSFLNSSNAFDDNDATVSTLSFSSTGVDSKTIGTTFTSKDISVAYVKFNTDMGVGASSYDSTYILQKYNGSTWLDIIELKSSVSQTDSFVGIVTDIGVCQGLRIKCNFTTDVAQTIDISVNDITYSTSFIYTPKYLLDSIKGGNNIEDISDRTAIAEDHTETWKSIYNGAMIGTAQNVYETLKHSGDISNQDFLFADIFSDSNGQKNTITGGTSLYDEIGERYLLTLGTDQAPSDTTHDPDGFSNPENAFDGDDITEATLVGSFGITEKVLGKTFSSKVVKLFKVVGRANMNYNTSGTATVSIGYQTYNGSVWSSTTVIDSDSVTNSSGDLELNVDKTVVVDDTVQGIRAVSKASDFGVGNGLTEIDYNSIEYGNFANSGTLITQTKTLDGTEESICIYGDKTIPNNTNITVDISDGVTTLSAQQLNTVIGLNGFSSGTLELTFNLTTTDTSQTPSLFGYSLYIK